MNTPKPTDDLKPYHEPQYEIALPCSPEDFRDFVGGLLGKPQKIEQEFYGSFEINLNALENLHHLIDQRIGQQNDATLIQFTARMIYSDNSSVQLSGFDNFQRYQEVHPKVSIGVALSWTYLVVFQRKTVPEKQQIEITFGRPELTYRDTYPSIELSILHTERTWGTDMQLLLAGHLQGLIAPMTPIRSFLSRNCVLIGTLSGLAFFAGSALGILHVGNQRVQEQAAIAMRFENASTASVSNIAERIDYLITIIGQGVWVSFSFAAVALLISALLLATLTGYLVADLLEKDSRAFILLTEAARRRKETLLHDDRIRLYKISISIIGSLAGGVLSNILYSKYFSGI